MGASIVDWHACRVWKDNIAIIAEERSPGRTSAAWSVRPSGGRRPSASPDLEREVSRRRARIVSHPSGKTALTVLLLCAATLSRRRGSELQAPTSDGCA